MFKIIKQIEDYPDYYISDKGNVYSIKTGCLKQLKPWLDSKKRYYMICLTNPAGKKKCLIHRLVANAFLDNINNYPEINHIDHDTKNNNVENLEWCTRLENMRHCFERYPPIRNFVNRTLIFPDGKQINFKSFQEVKRYIIKEKLDCSWSSLNVYHKSRGFILQDNNNNNQLK